MEIEIGGNLASLILTLILVYLKLSATFTKNHELLE